MNLLLFTRSNPRLIAICLMATGYGIYLIKRGIEGDTLCPGTNFTYLPRWLFIGGGILLQLPLPAALWFLHGTESL